MLQAKPPSFGRPQAQSRLSVRACAPLLLVFALVAPVYLLWTWSGTVGEIGSDATDYLLMAQHLSPYAKPSAAVAQAAAVSRFPPLYPLLLAWSGGAEDLYRAHLVTTVFFLAGLTAWYAWLRRCGLAPGAAALLLLGFAALPGSWMAGLSIQSEYPYLFWSLAALALLQHYELAARREALYAAAACVAAAALTRTIGVVLFAPLLCSALRGSRRRVLPALAAAAAPLLVWHLLHRAEGGYGGTIGQFYGEHPLRALGAQLIGEADALRRGFEDSFVPTLPARWLPDAIASACLASAAFRFRRRRPDGIYLAGYALILLIWPYPEAGQRLLWPVLPVLLSQPVLALAALRERPHRVSALTAGVLAAAMVAMAWPAILGASERYRMAADSGLPDARTYEGWYAADLQHAVQRALSQGVISAAARQIADLVPPGACVVATRKDLINYFGRRLSVFPPLNSVPDPAFMQLLKASGCRYVFMTNMADNRFPIPLHPLQRVQGHLRVLAYTERHAPPPGTGRVICILGMLD